MTSAEPAESCEATLLVPHPTRVAALVGAGGDGRAQLPTARLASAEPLLAEVLGAFDVVDPEAAVVLRQVMTSPSGYVDGRLADDRAITLLVELEPGTDEAPPGWVWRDLDEQTIAVLEPPTVRATVRTWAAERTTGWSPRRPPWSRPGWFETASAWMVEQLAVHGTPAVGPPRQHQLWGVSVVLRTPTAEADVYFKCSPEFFRHEAAVTRALAEELPDVPDVIAVDRARGWMLMRDLGAVELGDQDEARWHLGVETHARIQQHWLGREAALVDLGVPTRSLADLASDVIRLAEDDVLLDRMSPDLRTRWLTQAPSLIRACRRLDHLGPGPTLVHGDFHPWNVTSGPAGTRVFDWTDAAVSHPFVDLATYVFRTDDIAVRRQLVDAWAAAWSGVGSPQAIGEAVGLGLVVGSLYQVQTYRSLLPTLVGDGADDGMSDADLDWIDRSLLRHQHGLESPR